MAKYTVQQKIDVIALYKQGMSSTRISKAYNINEGSIRRWIEQFDSKGVSGLTSYGKQLQHFDTSFKLKVIHWLVRTNSSYPQAARHFNLPSASLIWNWKKRYDALGIDGLSDRRKLKVQQMNEEQLTPEQEIKQLRERLEYAEAEVVYLKKIRCRNETETNEDKAKTIDSLRPKYRLANLLNIAQMSSSSYYDAIKRNYGDNRIQDAEVLREIEDMYAEAAPHGTTLGYRPLTALLNQRRAKIQKAPINHKRVLRILRENNLLCHAFKRKTARYNSYVGKVGRVHNNKINRRFTSDRPLQK